MFNIIWFFILRDGLFGILVGVFFKVVYVKRLKEFKNGYFLGGVERVLGLEFFVIFRW